MVFAGLAIAADAGSIKALVRREHTFGSDWIKTTNTGGYFSAGDDPARVTGFDEDRGADIDGAPARHAGCRAHRRRRRL